MLQKPLTTQLSLVISNDSWRIRLTMDRDHKINNYNSTQENTPNSSALKHSSHSSWSHHCTCQEWVSKHLKDKTALNALVPHYFSKNGFQTIQFYFTPDYDIKVGQWYLRLTSTASMLNKSLGETVLNRSKGSTDQEINHQRLTLIDPNIKYSMRLEDRQCMISNFTLFILHFEIT